MPRILIVDDQSDVRTMIAMLLRVQRFDVVEAANASEAMTQFEAGPFDLAVVDIFLEAKSGVDVIVAMRDRVPNFPIVAISGMTALDFLADIVDLTDVVCLQKPFAPHQLHQAIEAARGSISRDCIAEAS